METNGNILSDENICQICDKKYLNRSGLWKHNNIKHKNLVSKSSEKVLKSSDGFPKISDGFPKIYCCRKCNKQFINIKTRWSHEQKCEKNSSELNKVSAEIKLEETKLLLVKEEAKNIKTKT